MQARTFRSTSTTTNDVGFYLFPSVQLGPYQMTVEAADMERWQGALTLMAGQRAELNVTLKVRATTAEVTVVGNVTPVITTNSPTLATVIERAMVMQLTLRLSWSAPIVQLSRGLLSHERFGRWTS